MGHWTNKWGDAQLVEKMLEERGMVEAGDSPSARSAKG